jgi:hypothetical protein
MATVVTSLLILKYKMMDQFHSSDALSFEDSQQSILQPHASAQ